MTEEKRNEDIVCTYVIIIIIINGSTHLLATPTFYSTLMTAHTIKNMCAALCLSIIVKNWAMIKQQ